MKKEELQRIKKLVKKTTPAEPFVMKRQGSDLSVIEERCRQRKKQLLAAGGYNYL